MKNKNGIKKAISILIILTIFISFMKIILTKLEEYEWDKKVYTSVNDFKSVKEVANYLECELIKEKLSDEENYKKDFYIKLKCDLYDGTKSNQGFFDNLISLIINVENYNSFRIIDKEKNIIIQVLCDFENKIHLKTIINGEENYFIQIDSKNSLEESKNTQIDVTDLKITSSKLQEIVNKKWNAQRVDFGKKESSFNGYDIYFEEGIEVKVINEKIYNIVFTEKYKDTVINNIKVGEENDKIIEILGEPTFGDKENLIGYKNNEFYVFFSNRSISVYKIDEYEKEELINIISKYEESQNLKDLVNNMTDLWYDYDNYDYDTNYIYLTFSAKGISIEAFDRINNPIKIYNNFEYIDEISEFTSIEFINEDLIHVQEENRLNEISIFPAEDEPERNFALLLTEKNETTYEASFVSMTENYASRELNENINDYIWYDENKFIYSINNKGIYIIDLRNGEKTTIVEEQGEIDIKNIENSILKYNEKEVRVEGI